MKKILKLLKKLDKVYDYFHSISLLSDKSGSIMYDGEEIYFFEGFKNCRKILKEQLKKFK